MRFTQGIMPILIKYLITSGLIVLISEVVKRSDRVGAMLAALPLVTTLAMIWMFFDHSSDQRVEKIANHAYYTFWYVVPTLPMFLVMPWMLRKGIHFGWALGAYCLGTMILFALFAIVVKRFGIDLGL